MRTRSTRRRPCSAATMLLRRARTRIYSRVGELLERLRGHGLPLAVVTNKAEAFTLPLLERMAIAQRTSTPWSAATPLPVKKPDPAMLHLTCARIGVAPGRR